MSEIPAIDIASTASCGAAPAGQTTADQTAATGKAAPNSIEQMKSLAAQFESMLLGQMMKQMRDSMSSDDEEQAKSSGFASGPLADQVYSELSLALSRAGGVGLGDALGGALKRQADAIDSATPHGRSLGMGLGLGIPVPSAMDLGMMQPASTTDAMTSPIMLGPAGRVTSSYGWRQDPMGAGVKFHNGTDVAMPIGTDVKAAQAGRVESVGDVSGYGLTVVLSHAGGVSTRYAHLSEADVKVGDSVAQGQVIAKSGSSGKSTGPHLHFEVIKDGQSVDSGLR